MAHNTSFIDIKRQILEDQRQALLEEYQVANAQLARTLSDVECVRLERQLRDLEQQIAKVEAELAAPSVPVPDPPQKPSRKAPIWVWYIVVVLLGFVLGVVTDLAALFELPRCTALWLAALLALISGIAILSFSWLPDQRNLHKQKDRIILVISTLVIATGLATVAWVSCREPPPPGLVTLQTYHGTYVTALNDEGDRDWKLRAGATRIDNWEKFVLICLDDGTAVLETSHRKFVTATAGDGWVLRAATEEYPEATQFTLRDPQTREKLPCSDVLKRSRIHDVSLALEVFPDRFVTAMDANGDWVVIADASEIKAWEQFTVTAP